MKSDERPVRIVKIAELKNRLSHYLRRVRSGETIVVRDRDAVIARIPPPRGSAARPLHRQLCDGFRDAIVARRLRGGQRLPSTRTLAAELGERGTAEVHCAEAERIGTRLENRWLLADIEHLRAQWDLADGEPARAIRRLDRAVTLMDAAALEATDGDGCTTSCHEDFLVKDTTSPAITSAPAGGHLGCNLVPLPDDEAIKAAVTATDTCGAATISVSHTDSPNGCLLTRTFAITATDSCGNPAETTVVYTWTVDTTPPTFTHLPTGTDLGCNPASTPDNAAVMADVTASDTCGEPTISVSHTDSVSGCVHTRTFAITATDGCGNPAVTSVQYTWTVDTTAPTFTDLPKGGDLGSDPVTTPEDATVQADVRANDACGAPTISVSHTDSDSGCVRTRTFAIRATDDCGNRAETTVEYTWTVDTTAPTFTFWQSLARRDGLTGETLATPRQKLSRAEALRIYTINGARAAFWEGRLGSIEPAKLADLVVLSDDIMTMPEDRIPETTVLATLLAGVSYGESLGARRLGGIALGFAGVAVIVTRGHPGTSSALGDLLTLGASLSWALYTVVGKPVLARATPLAVTAWASLAGAIPLLPLGLPGLHEVRWGALTAGQWLLLAYLSAGTIALGNLLWYVALSRPATARVGVFSFLVPVIATAIAVLAGQETLTASLALGAAAVLCGVALTRRA